MGLRTVYTLTIHTHERTIIASQKKIIVELLLDISQITQLWSITYTRWSINIAIQIVRHFIWFRTYKKQEAFTACNKTEKS